MTTAVATALAVVAVTLLFWRRWRRSTPLPPPPAADAPAPAEKPAYRGAKELREELDSAGLLAEAGRRKDKGNDWLGKGLLEPAMQDYLSAIWLLKVSRPPYPEVLSAQMPPEDEKAALLLGSGIAAPAPPRLDPGRVAAARRAAARTFAALWARAFPPPPPDALEDAPAAELRVALHLNVAACALKREDWYLAREACAFVLAKHPANSKALYRSARALDGAGDWRQALRTLTTLLRLEPQNREARALWEALRARAAEEKGLYRGLGAKEGFGSTDAPPPPEHAEKEDALTERIRALLDHEEREKEQAEAKAAAEAAATAEAAAKAAAKAAEAAAADAEAAPAEDGAPPPP